MACFCNCEFERYPQGWHEECHCVKPKGWPCPSDVSDEEADYIRERISERIGKLCDVTVIPGGQPIYDYIVSAE